MARARDPRRDQAYNIYKAHNGDIKQKDIAEQLGVSDGTIRGWKNKDSWYEKPRSNERDLKAIFIYQKTLLHIKYK